MEKDFFDRVKDLAVELFEKNILKDMPPATLISLINELAGKYNIKVEEEDLGEQKLPANERSWKRYQIWFNDPDSYEGGLYGHSEVGFEKAYLHVPTILQITAGIREVN